MSFDLEYALSILPLLLDGAVVTGVITVSGFAIAALVGIPIAIARLSPYRAIRAIAGGYVYFVRNTPFLIQLFFIFYVLPLYGLTLPALATGIAAIGLNYASYTSEVYRAAFQSVPREQWEAASVLNLPPVHVWRRIIFPQALVPAIPLLGNYFIGMFKETPLLATITIQELVGVALAEAGRTFRYFEPITLVGLLFLLFSLPAAFYLRRVESRRGQWKRAAFGTV